MKKFVLILFASIFLLPAAQAQNRVSLGVAIGAADQLYSDPDIEGSGVDTSIGIRVSVPMSPYMALEASLYDFGEADDSYIDGFGDFITTRTSAKSFNGGVAGIVPLSYTSDLVGRIGLSLWESELEFTDTFFPGEVFAYDDSGVGIYFGFGVRAGVAPNLKVGFEYMFFGFDPSFGGLSGDLTIDNFALTLDVGF